MQPDQIEHLFQLLEQIVYLLQAVFLACSCIGGFAMMQMIIHTKNQKHMF
jgi:hypothetical protein